MGRELNAYDWLAELAAPESEGSSRGLRPRGWRDPPQSSLAQSRGISGRRLNRRSLTLTQMGCHMNSGRIMNGTRSRFMFRPEFMRTPVYSGLPSLDYDPDCDTRQPIAIPIGDSDHRLRLRLRLRSRLAIAIADARCPIAPCPLPSVSPRGDPSMVIRSTRRPRPLFPLPPPFAEFR